MGKKWRNEQTFYVNCGSKWYETTNSTPAGALSAVYVGRLGFKPYELLELKERIGSLVLTEREYHRRFPQPAENAEKLQEQKKKEQPKQQNLFDIGKYPF